MRALVGALVVIVGCKGGEAEPVGAKTVEEPALALPRVDDPKRVMVLDNGHPGALVWIGAAGKLEVGRTGPTWSGDIDAKDRIPVAKVEDLHVIVLEAVIAGGGPLAVEAKQRLSLELANPLDNDPALARRQAIAQARAAGILGSSSPLDADPDVGAPGRLPSAPGKPIEDVARLSPLMLAAPGAPAIAVVRAVRKAGGVLGVSHHGKLAALNLAFEHEIEAPIAGTSPWIEVTTDTRGTHFAIQPADQDLLVPWRAGVIDQDLLRTTFGKIRENASGHARQVDVIVSEGTTAQSFVDLLVALETIGARDVAIADGPATVEERRAQIAMVQSRTPVGLRGRDPGPSKVTLGQPNAQGDLDKAIIRRYVKRNIAKVQFCYEKYLAVDAGLQGTLMVQFFITPEGKVASASASGVNPGVADCVADVIRKIEFPKPKGGGGVQVNYPFTFRSAP